MKTVPANYATLNAAANKSPVWVAIFSGLPANRGSFASADFADITGDYQKLITDLQFKSISIDRIEPHTDLQNEYDIVFQDQSLAFTETLADYNLKGIDVTVSIGFATLNFADFIDLPTLTVTDISLEPDLLSWRVRASSVLFKLNQKIFRSLTQTLLNGDHAAGVSTVTVDSTSGFRDPTASPAFPQWVKPCIIIDSEIKSYTGLTGTTFTGVATIGNTGDVDHFDNAVVKQGFAFCCDGLTAALHVLCTTDAGTNGYYDLKITGFGMGLPAAQVDTDTIEQLGYKVFNIYEYSDLATWPAQSFLFVTQTEDGLDWLERNCLGQGLCYFYINDNGDLSIDVVDHFWYLENFAADAALTNNDVYSAQVEFGEVINFVETQYQVNGINGNTLKVNRKLLDDSVDEYGQNALPFIYRMNSNPYNNALLNAGTPDGHYWNRRIFNAYQDMAGKIKLECSYDNLILNPNDDIVITKSTLPELTGGGARGWVTKKARIIGQEINFKGLTTLFCETHELFDRVAVLAGDDYTKNEVVEGSLDENNCTFNADKTLTIQANDAYYQNNVTAYDADLIVFFVEIAEQAGGLADGTIGLRLTAFNGSNLIDADDKNYIHFRPSGTTVHLMPLYLHITNSPTGIATVKLDWFYRSSSDSAENPVVTLKKLWFVKFNRAMSTP